MSVNHLKNKWSIATWESFEKSISSRLKDRKSQLERSNKSIYIKKLIKFDHFWCICDLFWSISNFSIESGNNIIYFVATIWIRTTICIQMTRSDQKSFTWNIFYFKSQSQIQNPHRINRISSIVNMSHKMLTIQV